MLSIQAVRGLLAFVHLASFLALSLFLAWYWKKLNLSQQKHAFTNQKKCTTTQNKKTKTEKQLKPGLVAFYEIRPGNGAFLCSKEKTSK